MKSSNVMAALVTLSLAATAATPAMALENEFHGLFSARYINSNFNRTQTTDYGPGDGTYDPSGKTKNQYSSNFIEQRERLTYIAKANADVKLITQFELDYSYWGNSSYTVGRNQGGAIGADTVNLETKNIYLDANPFKNINMKLGMMPNTDAFKGVLFDTDMAGILLSSSYGKFSPSIGFFRFNDGSSSIDKALGKKTSDLLMLDGKFNVTNELKVGGAYYFFGNNQGATTNPVVGYTDAGAPIYANDPTVFEAKPDNNIKIHVLGLNAEYVQGPLTLNGFAIYETGWNNKRYTSAFSGNIGAKLNAGPGTARAEFLYVTGDSRADVSGATSRSNAFYSAAGEHGYYNNEMVILGRDKNAYTTDNSIIFNAGNEGRGQIGGYLGYDLPINDRLTTAYNAGFAAVAKDSTAKPHKSNYLGTEINAEATYKLIENLTTSVRAGYVFLGDYYKGVALHGETPVNPYDAKLMFTYIF
ncbi:MAG: hypothetical protein PHH28_07055 [Desulfuromonadaceae bacterium]|nr:hypothetical protein [Desulfuromonadaceae bacterium]